MSSRRGRRRSGGCGWKLWALFWACVGLSQVWDISRDHTPLPKPVPDGNFSKLAGARLVEDANNDGDSFKIAMPEGMQTLRLYFVDCPEKQDYPRVHGRLLDQAGYFGGLSIQQTVGIGMQAKMFTEKLLREQPFTVHTRWTKVYGGDRIYALVLFSDGEDLAEKLVRHGLCRIYTRGTRMPAGQAEYEFEKHLRILENEAKAARRGAWALMPQAGIRQ